VRRTKLIAGLISVTFYLLFVLYSFSTVGRCYEVGGLMCAYGYVQPGLPWVLVFGLLADAFLPKPQLPAGNEVFYVIITASILINVLIAYGIGCVIGNFVHGRLRRRSNTAA
jgi:hypothetical protein